MSEKGFVRSFLRPQLLSQRMRFDLIVSLKTLNETTEFIAKKKRNEERDCAQKHKQTHAWSRMLSLLAVRK